MADVQIHPTGTEPAPADYSLPLNQGFIPKSVYAHYDGSGAAGAYIPVLEILSNAKTPIGQYRMGSSVAAGSSVEASWAPFLRGDQAAAASQTSLAWAVCNFPAAAVTVAAGGHAQFGSTTGTEHFHTNDPATYQLALNVAENRYGIQVLSFGHYMMFGSFAVTSFGAGAIDLDINLADGPQEVHSTGTYGVREVLSSTKIYGDDNNNVTLTSITLVQATTGSGGLPAATVWNVDNFGANTAQVIGYGYNIFQLDNQDVFVS